MLVTSAQIPGLASIPNRPHATLVSFDDRIRDRRLQSLVHHVYIVRCADGSLYTGYALDPQEREKVHNTGRGARYTASRLPVSLIYSECFASKSDALKREHELKRLTRGKKEALISAATPPGHG